ncbi:uncharacterized protein LOC144451396 [Glandiceps talaboti]
MRWTSLLVVFFCGQFAVFPGVLSDCADPGQIDNGDRTDTVQSPTGSHPFGDWSMVQYTCHDNYTISGPQTVFCDSGTWSAAQPVCKADCWESNVADLPNGSILGLFPVSGTGGKVSLQCDVGYTLFGADEIACTDGSFGTYAAVCQVDCGQPTLGDLQTIESGFPEDGDAVPSGTQITYGCIDGYSVVGPDKGTCNNGAWDYVAVCVVGCPALNLDNVILSSDATHADSEVSIYCKPGFIPSEEYKVKCNSGSWSGTIPTCVDEFADHILAYFPFENDFKDNGVNGYGLNGVQEGSVTFAEKMGVYRTAASFSGKGRVDVSNNFNNFSDFSVSLWFKRTGQWDSYQGIMSMGGYDQVDGVTIMMGDEKNGQSLSAGLITETKSEPWNYVNILATANRWHHVVASYDGSEFRLYLDGAKQDGWQDCCSGYIVPGYARVRIGQAGPPILKQYFYGLIDEVYILDIAVDDYQALTLYERDVNKCDPGDENLLVHLEFEKGFEDTSCYGWHGIPYGDVVVVDGTAVFYGKGQINIEQFSNYMWGSEFSVSFLYKCNTCQVSGEEPSKYPETIKGLITNGFHSPGTFELALEKTESGTYLAGGVVESGFHNKLHESMIDNNGWQQVALVFDGDNSYLYYGSATNKLTFVNGQGDLPIKSSPVTIGVTGSGDLINAHYFQGLIDDVKIYSVAMSGDELF